jgi:hypothetical protein
VQVPVAQLEQEIVQAKAAFQQDPSWQNLFPMATGQYANNMYARGDNTRANAVAAGVLDARELYPDFVPTSLAEYAKGWYRAPTEFPYAMEG